VGAITTAGVARVEPYDELGPRNRDDAPAVKADTRPLRIRASACFVVRGATSFLVPRLRLLGQDVVTLRRERVAVAAAPAGKAIGAVTYRAKSGRTTRVALGPMPAAADQCGFRLTRRPL
jgi:hypothetical protein